MKRERKYTRVLLTDELGVEEIARVFGMTRQTITKWLSNGKLKSRSINDVIALRVRDLALRVRAQ